MPVVHGLTRTVPAGTPFYRITSTHFRKLPRGQHKRVVNGEGSVKSRDGARYNYPGARAVYLAEDPLTCLAECMFYFHREVLGQLDNCHITGFVPLFHQAVVLWEVVFRNDIPDVFDLNLRNASAMNVFPSLMLNPSQDYEHLKDRRAAIESSGYRGLHAPSSRSLSAGNMVVLFEDQSRNVQTITPFDVEFRLITADHPPKPFANHAIDLLDFTSGEVRVLPPPGAAGLPPPLTSFRTWQRVDFHH